MSYSIHPASGIGRLGEGFGRGLSEQLPKEVERYRLASGLKNLSSMQENDPLEQMAYIASLPATPQMIQTFGELLKMRNVRNAYGKSSSQEMSGGSSEGREGQHQDSKQRMNRESSMPKQEEMLRQVAQAQKPFQAQESESPPQIVQENPLAQKFVPGVRWTPQQRNAAVSKYINQGFLPEKAEQLASNDEERFLGSPEDYRKQMEYFDEQRKNLNSEFDRKLQKVLQKSPEGTFQDITGEMQANIERSMQRDLRENPNLTTDDITSKWAAKALETAKAKKEFDTTASTTGIESLIKGKTPLKKLEQYSRIFKDSGNSEEYKKMLVSKMKLSQQGASDIAFEPNKKIQKYIEENISPSPNSTINRSLKYAKDISKMINSGDSLLGIAHRIKSKDPFFDEREFFDLLREQQEDLSLNERQRREIAEGESDIIPHWGDILVFPFYLTESIRRAVGGNKK
jgi:hypothetical protein